LTALKAPELARRALAGGFAAIVLKSDAFDDLVFAIRAVVGGRQFVSASLGDKMLGDALTPLTNREQEVLTLVAQGLTNNQIAIALGISPKTVDNHRTRLMRKVDAHSTADLVRYAIRVGLIDA
jgi:DNA-binding NarL/FixJ family response regulator